MRVRSLARTGWWSRFAAVAIAASSLVAAGCSSDPAPAPEPLLVRTASGATLDVNGKAWAACILDEVQWRRTVMSFGPGTLTITDTAYATSSCTGDPASATTTVVSTIVATGDHAAGWGTEGPPPGVATTVTATGVIITWPETSDHPGPGKNLLFVNDGASPDALHFGGKTAGPDGYPTTLEPTARTLVP